MINQLIIQIAYVAIYEEAIFRGFLWGYLEKKKWDNKWILVFQGILFWLLHLYYLPNSPIVFWISVPLVGLILGLVAWRSRSITTTIIIHALYNTLGRL